MRPVSIAIREPFEDDRRGPTESRDQAPSQFFILKGARILQLSFERAAHSQRAGQEAVQRMAKHGHVSLLPLWHGDVSIRARSRFARVRYNYDKRRLKAMVKHRLPLSERALNQRINRKLKQDGKQLRTARSPSVELSRGRYFIVDVNHNSVTAHHIHLEELGHELGVLKPWEKVG
jgi:hypothetical protein